MLQYLPPQEDQLLFAVGLAEHVRDPVEVVLIASEVLLQSL